jgi:hypothetical protein
MTDRNKRLAEIRAWWAEHGQVQKEDIDWLLAEVERLESLFLSETHKADMRVQMWKDHAEARRAKTMELARLHGKARRRAKAWKACAKRWRTKALIRGWKIQGLTKALNNTAEGRAEAHLIRIRELEAEVESYKTAELARLAEGK